jgi:hypothetical protein
MSFDLGGCAVAVYCDAWSRPWIFILSHLSLFAANLPMHVKFAYGCMFPMFVTEFACERGAARSAWMLLFLLPRSVTDRPPFLLHMCIYPGKINTAHTVWACVCVNVAQHSLCKREREKRKIFISGTTATAFKMTWKIYNLQFCGDTYCAIYAHICEWSEDMPWKSIKW